MSARPKPSRKFNVLFEIKREKNFSRARKYCLLHHIVGRLDVIQRTQKILFLFKKMPVCINNYIVNRENGVFNRPMGAFIRVKKIKLAALRSVYVFINCSLLQSLVSFTDKNYI